MAESGLDPKYLELELTESLLMHDVEQAIATMSELQSIGVQFAIDDFGTGYSSLSVLKNFPADAQLAFLRDSQCDEIQGYHFSKPIEPNALGDLLGRQAKQKVDGLRT